jgi:hypothetical protein
MGCSSFIKRDLFLFIFSQTNSTIANLVIFEIIASSKRYHTTLAGFLLLYIGTSLVTQGGIQQPHYEW